MALKFTAISATDVNTKAKILTEMDNHTTQKATIVQEIIGYIKDRQIPPGIGDLLIPALNQLQANAVILRTGINANLT